MRGTKSIRYVSLACLLTLCGSIVLSGCTVNSNDRVPTPNMGVNPYRVNTGFLLRNAVERGTLRIATERDYPLSVTVVQAEYLRDSMWKSLKRLPVIWS